MKAGMVQSAIFFLLLFFCVQSSFAQTSASTQLNEEPKGALSQATIGVMLPLSKDNAAYGRRVLNAIELGLGLPTLMEMPAQKIFSQNNSSLTLVVADSQSDPATFAATADALMASNKFSVLLGDINSEASDILARKAQSSSIPILLYSRSNHAAGANSFVFRVGISSDKQADELVKRAMKQGAKKFAILYPHHAYGKEMMNSFWRSIEKNHGVVTAFESYERNQNSFGPQIKKLIGTFDLSLRPEYQKCLQAIEAEAEEFKAESEKKCAEQVESIVDFDALFIPDAPQNLSYIIPALAAEKIIGTTKVLALGDSPNPNKLPAKNRVQLLGAGSWNNALLASRAGPLLDDALFVDAFNFADAELQSHSLISYFKEHFAAYPSTIEAQAYIAASVLKEVFNKNMATIDAASIRKDLASAKKFNAFNETFFFDSNGDASLAAHWFSFNNGEIKALADSPKKSLSPQQVSNEIEQ